METGTEKRQPVPPYVAYRTFKNFLDSLRVAMPARIDRSIMASMSGATQGQLIATLRYLDLVSPNGIPSERLAALVKSEGAERQRILWDGLRTSYRFLFSGGFDVGSATARQLEEQFNKAGVSGETVRKCIAFFIAAAREAELPLSPYISSTKGTRNTAQRTRRTQAVATLQTTLGREIEPVGSRHTTSHGWSEVLLSKFPNFDPSWSDEVKSKWFDAFERLTRSIKEIFAEDAGKKDSGKVI